MAAILTGDDLRDVRPRLSKAEAESMTRGAVARAARIAPCILDPDFEHRDAARAIILDALLRRADGGSGSVTHEQRGPFSQSVESRSTLNLFTTQERADLADLCKPSGAPARTIWTAPTAPSADPLAGARINGLIGKAPGGL